MSIRVLTDARALSESSAYRGIGTYLRQLLAHLGSMPDLAVTALAVSSEGVPEGVDVPTLARAAYEERVRSQG